MTITTNVNMSDNRSSQEPELLAPNAHNTSTMSPEAAPFIPSGALATQTSDTPPPTPIGTVGPSARGLLPPVESKYSFILINNLNKNKNKNKNTVLIR